MSNALANFSLRSAPFSVRFSGYFTTRQYSHLARRERRPGVWVIPGRIRPLIRNRKTAHATAYTAEIKRFELTVPFCDFQTTADRVAFRRVRQAQPFRLCGADHLRNSTANEGSEELPSWAC